MLRCAHMELPSALDRAIMRTLCWFAIFEYPLSVFELWKWLWSPGRAYSLEEIEVAVENHAWLAERMERVDGFVAVRQPRGVEEWVRLRRERYVDAARKFGKLKRVAHWFAMLTWNMTAATNEDVTNVRRFVILSGSMMNEKSVISTMKNTGRSVLSTALNELRPMVIAN